ncbi:phage major capsid family protein [Companilactobacillus nodensis]|uniref:Phage structural protein n=1 Tax=Companilactobacillus nodensis DSM 19682 = JCM 14932 = NBRC 107160 TaxID=1423775 RepID=A0A0R1KC99_9LACO|nr:phage major capsid protein [Companilactobacillus nodensis]KRK78489.1 phage structural protein [Companilactobacillus nodensis DSM 19682 = JCM 14932 = NBRC 107160]
MTTSKGNLFDPTLITDLISKVKGNSSLAILSGQKPVAFNGQKEFTFSMDKDIDIVAENGKKTEGGVTIAPVTIVPIKVEYGARVSDEFIYATDEEKIDILKAFNDGYAKKLARGLDLMAFHGVNPRTKEVSAIIGKNSFDTSITQTVDFKQADPDSNIEDAVSAIQGSDGVVSGMAIDTQFSSALAKMRDNSNNRLFPTLAWGANPGSINGLQTDVNNTVASGSKDYAILGDFTNMFQWGFAKQIPMEVIQYGDPDNSGQDLKGYNQVYLRSETYLGWGIMDTNSFARVIKPEEA